MPDVTDMVMWTVRMPKDLAEHLDAEAVRRGALAGVKVSRTGALMAVLREHQKQARALDPASLAVKQKPTEKRPPTPVASKPVQDKTRARPKAERTAFSPLDEAALRKRCRAIQGASSALAKVLGLTSASTVRHWWAGNASWEPAKLAKVVRWLEKQR
jgi:hypothetical protein